MIKTVFFDAAGTLFHLPKGVGAHYRDVAWRFDCYLNEDALSQAFRRAWREMPVRGVLRQPRPDDDKDWWRALVHRVLEHCSVPEEQLDRAAYFEALYAEFTRPGIWELFPEVREVLTSLRPHYRLGLISNFDGRLRAILAHLGLDGWFDPIVISSEAGANKPEAWIFERALALAETTTQEALHVGDDPRCDWQGAADAGLHVFRLERPGNSLRDLLAQLGRPLTDRPAA